MHLGVTTRRSGLGKVEAGVICESGTTKGTGVWVEGRKGETLH